MQHQTDHYSRRVGPGWICFSARLEMWQSQGGELGAPWHGAGQCPLGSVPWAVSLCVLSTGAALAETLQQTWVINTECCPWLLCDHGHVLEPL